MALLPATIATSAGAFAATNVDSLILLVILFAEARAGAVGTWRVVAGQWVAFALLVGASVAAATALAAIPVKWVGLLGLIPLTLGLRGLITARRGKESEPSITARVPVLVVLSLSVCADNLSVYIVLFRVQTTAQSVLSVGVFVVLEALWCVCAFAIANSKPVMLLVRRAGVWLVPVLFVALGIAITVRTGLLTR